MSSDRCINGAPVTCCFVSVCLFDCMGVCICIFVCVAVTWAYIVLSCNLGWVEVDVVGSSTLLVNQSAGDSLDEKLVVNLQIDDFVDLNVLFVEHIVKLYVGQVNMSSLLEGWNRESHTIRA